MPTATLQDRFHDLLFGVRRSIRYHNRRRTYYDRFHKFNMIVGVVGGSAVIAALLGEFGDIWPLAFSALIAVSAATDLVINSSQMARFHHDLSRKYFEIEKEMVSYHKPTEEAVVEWTERRLSIEADEPPVLHVLNTICHNELCRALGYGQQVKLGRLQRLFSSFFDLGEHKLNQSLSCEK